MGIRHNHLIFLKIINGLCFFLLLSFCSNQAWAADPWQALQGRYPAETEANAPNKEQKNRNPWEQLWVICLPFTEKTEDAALIDPKAGEEVSSYLHQALRPYEDIISEASKKFNIPKEVIGAVIMVESGGNSNAKAATSTASGLMQTISSTFQEARNGLLSRGVFVKNNPFDAYASVMAGSWYLDKMFKVAAQDRKYDFMSRQDIFSWRLPVEYYYAGPNNGKKGQDVVIMYSGGRQVVIEKAAYSKKVLRWARIMERQKVAGQGENAG